MRTFGFPEFLFILEAAKWTLALSAIAFVGGAILGLVIALMRTSESRWARGVSTTFIQIFQGTPLLLQLFLVFFGAPVLGLDINPWVAAGVALILNSAAFLGEIWRGCIEAIPRGQWEAAEALSLKYSARMRDVVLPQALQDRAGAHGGLRGADHQGHVARGHHRLRRGHARRADREQRHLPAAHRVLGGGGHLLRDLLAAVAAGRAHGAQARPRARPLISVFSFSSFLSLFRRHIP
jgi:His/Glu/Gln/Arg/opine family amino acid ABC transporter permease subunit